MTRKQMETGRWGSHSRCVPTPSGSPGRDRALFGVHDEERLARFEGLIDDFSRVI
jgi:hypothetical protein